VEGLAGLKDRLTAGWLEIPKTFPKSLKVLADKIEAQPDQTATIDYREAMRKKKAAEIAWTSAKAAYEELLPKVVDQVRQ
jgi:hypothetical protein